MNPLVDPPPQEVPLATAPLERVVAQVRFPLITSIEKESFVGSFQEAIRDEYPVLRPEQQAGVVLAPQGALPLESPRKIWRFHGADGTWRVSLAPDFVAIETGAYSSRRDFLARLRRAVEAVERCFGPTQADRLGLRYVDRITGPTKEDLQTLLRPQFAGILATEIGDSALHAIHEALFPLTAPRGNLAVRWGRLPARGTLDPSVLQPIEEPSWFLDLDAFTHQVPFQSAPLLETAERLAERVYAFFRWAVTDSFLHRFGGTP